MSNSNECAYPVLETEIGINFHPGLTKREAFAMAAMQGMSSDPEFYGQSVEFAKNIAVDCVKLADALLAELSK